MNPPLADVVPVACPMDRATAVNNGLSGSSERRG